MVMLIRKPRHRGGHLLLFISEGEKNLRQVSKTRFEGEWGVERLPD